MARDPLCVFYANNTDEADFVVAWLGDRRVKARIKEWWVFDATATTKPVIDAPFGIEICVLHEKDVARAWTMLRDDFVLPTEREQHVKQGASIDAACESCGASSSFPQHLRKSVQTCPNCGEFLDVPAASDPQN
ncbi:MAG: hypothetical protein IIB57_04660 [Planctomycetes bacterium]|nr:hypothetical protein [Planctomycetota bacterium]